MLYSVHQNQNTTPSVRSKDVELDEEAIAVEAEFSPPAAQKTIYSVASKAAVSPRQMSTPAAHSSTKNSPSEQKTSNNADNENTVSSIEERNLSISSSRANRTNVGRRRAKYR